MKKSRARRVLWSFLVIVASIVTFVVSVALGVIIHLDVPATRRLVATQATTALQGVFAGRITIERIGNLGVRGVSDVRVHIDDPDGLRVIAADGVHARIDTLALLRSALLERGDLRIPFDDAGAANADVALDADATGQELRLAKAFAPKMPSEPKKDEKPGRGTRVELPRLALGHAWIHGAPPGAPLVDADIADLRGAVDVTPAVVALDLARARVVARALPPRGTAALRGDVTANVKLPSAEGAGPIVAATFEGDIAGAHTTADAQLDGKRLDARVDIASLTGAELASAIADVPLAQAVTLHAEAHGELPRIAAIAHAEVGRGTVDADATIDTGTTTTIRATATARHIDLRVIAPAAPSSDLGLDARGTLALAAGDMRGEVSAQTLPGRLDRDAVPPVQLHATIANDAVYGAARIADARMPTDVAVALFPDGRDQVVEARIASQAPELRRVPMVGELVTGSARVRGEARLNLGTKTLSARVDVDGSHLAQGAQTAASLHGSARASGTLDRPIVDADLDGSGVKAGPLDAQRIQAHARVAPLPELVVTDARVDIDRPNVSVAVRARRVALGKAGRLTVEDATIAGLGEPLRVSMTKDARELRVIADADAIDLTRVASLLGKEKELRGGRVELHGDVAIRKDDASGQLHAKVDGLKTEQLPKGAGARIDARIIGRDVDVDIQAALGDAGRFTVKTHDVTIGGSPMTGASWKAAKGRLDLDGELDLARVASLVPQDTLPLSELRGRLVFVGHTKREAAEGAPDVSFSAYTLGLVAAGKTNVEPAHADARVRGVAPWRTVDLDAELDVRADAAERHGEVAMRLVDRDGIVAALDAKGAVPFEELLRDPSGALAKLEEMDVSAKVTVPKRRLDALPAVLGLRRYAGTVEASLEASGTALAPHVAFAGHVRGAKGAALPLTKAADADVTFAYDGVAADLGVTMATSEKQVLAVASHVNVSARDLVARAPASELAWNGSTHVRLDDFPLQAIDPVASRRVRGNVSGEATLDGLHENAAFHARLESKDLKIGRAKFTGMKVAVDAAAGAFTADARVDQSDGHADVRARAAIRWGRDLAPSVDRDKPMEASLEAKAFRAAALAPFVQGTLNELDGRIDANAQVALGGRGQSPVKMQGRVTLTDGTVQIASVGEELHDARFTVTLSPDGTVKLTDLSAKGVEGELTADAQAKLRGLGFETASANVHIPNKKALDVALQGQPIGRINGDVHVTATATPDMSKINVKVDVPVTSLELPQVMKSGLQDLADPKDIRAGVFRSRRDFVRLPYDAEDLEPEKTSTKPATTLDIAIHVGQATIVRGNQARVVIGGDPHVVVTDKARISGQIQLRSGKLDLQGKQFDIEKGTITFQPEDPSNPIVVATASWTAEDGTKVLAEFVGPVKTGKVALRSEPPRPKNEILALILFGTADGANAAPPPAGRQPDGTTQAATAVGGGFAAQGLSEAIDDLTGVQATARIDTTHSDNPRPELEFQIARDVSVQFAHVLGTPPISEPDTNYATLDWRFKRKWSVETTFGDRGSAMFDVVWQKRY